MTTTLVLVRHGQSRVTVDRVVGGPKTCTGLSDLGRAQAAALRDRLLRHGGLRAATRLVASTLRRAVETAEIVRPGVGPGDLEISCHDDLCELLPGECDGLPWPEFEARYGAPPWDEDPTVPLSPGGESLAAFQARVAGALDRLAAEHAGEHVVVACHGGVIVQAMHHLARVPTGRLGTLLDPRNTGLTTFVAVDGGGWQLERYDDAAHLEWLAGG